MKFPLYDDSRYDDPEFRSRPDVIAAFVFVDLQLIKPAQNTRSVPRLDLRKTSYLIRRQFILGWPNRNIFFDWNCRETQPNRLRQNTLDHFSGNIGQPEIATLKSISEPLMINSKKVKNRCVQVMDMNPVLDHAVSKLTSFAPGGATFDPTSCHPS